MPATIHDSASARFSCHQTHLPDSQFGSCSQSAGMRQRRPCFQASRNAGEVATVSTRALFLRRGSRTGLPPGFFGGRSLYSMRSCCPARIIPHCPSRPTNPPSASAVRNIPASNGPTVGFGGYRRGLPRYSSKAKAAYGALQATNLTNPLVGPLKVTRACGRRAPFLAAAGGCYAAGAAVLPTGADGRFGSHNRHRIGSLPVPRPRLRPLRCLVRVEGFRDREAGSDAMGAIPAFCACARLRTAGPWRRSARALRSAPAARFRLAAPAACQ